MERELGTFAKDEAAILEKLEKSPEGMCSTELFYSVHKTVRSLTTYQKRLRHLKDAGRIQIKDSIDDRRETIITPTPKSQEASDVLEAIDLLQRLYLGKASKKTVKITEHREGQSSETEMDETAAVNLLKLAHETFLEGLDENQSRTFIYVDKRHDDIELFHMDHLVKISTFYSSLRASLRRWLEVEPTSPLTDEWRQLLTDLGPEGETTPSSASSG